MGLVLKTVKLSLVIQVITGLLAASGFLFSLKPKDKILWHLLSLETFVQFVEFSFYVWLVMNFHHLKNGITNYRYIDWSITTPIMLINTVFFMHYLSNQNQNQNENKNKDSINIKTITKENFKVLAMIIAFNTLMLLSGFLGEAGYINRYLGLVIGFIGLAGSFGLIYKHYVGNNSVNKLIWVVILFLWTLYGIAYLLPYTIKNSSYNILDVFSKNLYGLFIAYYIIFKVKR